MGKWVEWAVLGFFGAIVAMIVFVKAGRGGGESGGKQTAQILKGGGNAIASVASALEGNAS